MLSEKEYQIGNPGLHFFRKSILHLPFPKNFIQILRALNGSPRAAGPGNENGAPESG